MGDDRETSDRKIGPIYTHDCTNCIHLGHAPNDQPGRGEGDTLDLYLCPQPSGFNDLVARFGSDGPQYSSTDVHTAQRIMEIENVVQPEARRETWPFKRALELAYERGLLKETLTQQYLREAREALDASPQGQKSDRITDIACNVGSLPNNAEAERLQNDLFDRVTLLHEMSIASGRATQERGLSI